jgi:hypothetical protein
MTRFECSLVVMLMGIGGVAHRGGIYFRLFRLPESGEGGSALGTAQPPIDGCRAVSIEAQASTSITLKSRSNHSGSLHFS